MTVISDGLLIAGALAAAFYCYVLARRVRMLGNLDSGLGSAIAGLSKQVEDLQGVLASVKAAARNARSETNAAAERAERAANRLQLLLTTAQLSDEARGAEPVAAHGNYRVHSGSPAEPPRRSGEPTAPEPQRTGMQPGRPA